MSLDGDCIDRQRQRAIGVPLSLWPFPYLVRTFSLLNSRNRNTFLSDKNRSQAAELSQLETVIWIGHLSGTEPNTKTCSTLNNGELNV